MKTREMFGNRVDQIFSLRSGNATGQAIVEASDCGKSVFRSVGPRIELRAEKGTWSKAALWLLDKVLNEIGARIIEGLEGTQAKNKLVTKYSQEIAVRLGQILDERDLSLADRDLETIIVTMGEYANAPERLDRVTTVTIFATKLMVQLERFGYVTLGAYMVALNCKLLILQERRDVFKDPAEDENIKNLIKDSRKYMEPLADQLLDQVSDSLVIRWGSPAPGEPVDYWVWDQETGKHYPGQLTYQGAQQEKEKLVQEKFRRLYPDAADAYLIIETLESYAKDL